MDYTSENRKKQPKTAFLNSIELFKYWKHHKLKLPRPQDFPRNQRKSVGAKLFSKSLEYVMEDVLLGKTWFLGKMYQGPIKIKLKEHPEDSLSKILNMPFMNNYDINQANGYYHRPVLDFDWDHKYPFYMGVSMPKYLEAQNNSNLTDPDYEFSSGRIVFGHEIMDKVNDFYGGIFERRTIKSACLYGLLALKQVVMKYNVGVMLNRKSLYNSDTGFTFYPMDRGVNKMTIELIGASARGKSTFLEEPIEWVWNPKVQFTKRGVVKTYIYPFRRIGLSLFPGRDYIEPAPKELTKQLHRTYRRYYHTVTKRLRYCEEVLVPKELITI